MAHIPIYLHLLFLHCPRGEVTLIIATAVYLYASFPHRDNDGLRDVTDNDVADENLVTCSDESKVLTSEDTSIDQPEGENTLP